MPSRVERARRAMEWGARLSLLALLVMLTAREFLARPEVVVEGINAADLADALPRWTLLAPTEVSVTLERSPSPEERAWLAALRGAATPVHWSAPGASPLVTAADVVRAPGGWIRVDIAAADRSTVILSDQSGDVDTIVATGGGGSVRLPALWGAARASAGLWSAVTPAPRGDSPRRVLVLGGVGWESKFVITALEETGWVVDAALALRPGAGVFQGANSAPDTARYAAVIVLDSIPDTTAARIAGYVRAGGGLVVAPAAWGARSFRSLLAGGGGRVIRSRPGTLVETPLTLGVRTLVPVAYAVPLGKRGAEVVVAARRVESGRVMQLGYDESWRWRMTGAEGSVQAHRDWWSSLVSAVAFAPASNAEPLVSDEAPLARLTAALGPPSSVIRVPLAGAASSGMLMALLFMLLLGEIASRRLRGAR